MATLMRLSSLLAIAVAGCSVDQPSSTSAWPAPAEASPPLECSPEPYAYGCSTCSAACAFREGCPSISKWCGGCDGGAGVKCPTGYEPLFCDGEPPLGQCLVVLQGSGCAGTQVYCCSPEPIDDTCATDADCAPTGHPCYKARCLAGHCWVKPMGNTDGSACQ